MLAIFSFIFLGFVIPILLLGAIGNESILGVSGFSAFLSILYGSIRASLSLRRHSQPILYGIFGVFVYINFGLAALLQGVTGNYFWPGHYSDESVLLANLIIFGGIISFEVGILLAGKISIPLTNTSTRVFTPKKMKWFLPVSLIGTVFFFIISGWHRAIFSFRNQAGQIASEFSIASSQQVDLALTALFRSLPLCMSVISGLLVLHYKKNIRIRNDFSRKTLLAYFIIFCSISIIIANPISAARYWQGTVGIALLIVFFNFVQVDGRRWIPSMLVFAYLLIFPAADSFRREMSGREFSELVNTDVLSNVSNSLMGGDYDSFQQTLNSIEFVEGEGIQWGRQLSGAFLFFIPRSGWSNKAEPTSVLIATASGYEFTNLGCPLWAEAYVDLGILGVALVLGLFGFIIAKIERGYMNEMTGTGFGKAFVVLFAGYEIFFLRGTLIVAVSYFSATLLILILAQEKSSLPSRKLFIYK